MILTYNRLKSQWLVPIVLVRLVGPFSLRQRRGLLVRRLSSPTPLYTQTALPLKSTYLNFIGDMIHLGGSSMNSIHPTGFEETEPALVAQ